MLSFQQLKRKKSSDIIHENKKEKARESEKMSIKSHKYE